MFCRKWKIKNVVVLDVWSAAHLEAFLIKQDMLFLHISNVLGVWWGECMQSLTLYAKAWRLYPSMWSVLSLSDIIESIKLSDIQIKSYL